MMKKSRHGEIWGRKQGMVKGKKCSKREGSRGSGKEAGMAVVQ